MTPARVSPQLQYVCVPVTPKELSAGLANVVVILQPVVWAESWLEVGDTVMFIFSTETVGEVPAEPFARADAPVPVG